MTGRNRPVHRLLGSFVLFPAAQQCRVEMEKRLASLGMQDEFEVKILSEDGEWHVNLYRK